MLAQAEKLPPIAIVGVSGRFPGGANGVEQLWGRLKAGDDLVGVWPKDRWDEGFYHHDAEREGKIYVKAGGFLDQIDQFDAEFFGIVPREAARIDPQQRLLLELSWEALEDGGLSAERLAGSRTGVFVGISSNDYVSLQGIYPDSINAYTNAGGALSIAANRISYFFDLCGPSMAIDTACSSSLVALHQGCRSIWSGESTQSLVGGVNVLAQPTPFIGFCKASMLSPEGRCKSFDADGNGYVRAEGGVVLILKPLVAAERDHDRIHGLIIATGVNSDGRTRGLALPNEHAQEALLREIYGKAGIAPQDVFYVEAHGTGTAVGDPAECNAIGRVLGAARRNGEVCYVGSIKSNIGHLEPASGVAGIAKILLALRHREIPRNLHFNTPNPNISFEELKLKVVDEPVALPERERPLLMGINSFGFGGTNAHAVIQEYTARRNGNSAGKAIAPGERMRLLIISARTIEALRAMASDYAKLLAASDGPALDAICATAALRRSRLPHRLAVSGTNPGEIAERLRSFASGDTPGGAAHCRVAAAATEKLAFVFCGNGPQWSGMGRDLMAAAPTFRRIVSELDEHFKALSGWSICEEMANPRDPTRIARTEIAQPLLFALQIGLAAMLNEAGLKASAVIGHSVGEAAAAYLSGALSLEDSVRVIYERSRAQAMTQGRGKMAAVGLAADAVRPLLAEIGGWIEIAAVNSPKSVTVAGDAEALERLGARVARDKVFFKVLALDYAFHSRAMEPIREPLIASLGQLGPRGTRVPFISTAVGSAVAGESLGADYWWRNVREPVQFGKSIKALIDEGIKTFIEIGPHPVLRDYISQTAEAGGTSAVTVQTLRRPSGDKPERDAESVLNAICTCLARGAGVDFEAIFGPPSEPAPLPAYPWQRQVFWNGAKFPILGSAHLGPSDHPLLGRQIPGPNPAWESIADPEIVPYLADHVVQGAIVFPGAGYLEMALAAARLIHGEGPSEVEDLDIRKALVISDGKAPFLQFTIDPENGTFKIAGTTDRVEKDWAIHAVGKLGATETDPPAPIALEQLRRRLRRRVDHQAHYEAAARLGLAYGPAFRGVVQILAGEGEALAEIAVPEVIREDLANYRVHPALSDACIQLLTGLIEPNARNDGAAYLPVQLKKFRLCGEASELKYCSARVVRRGARSIVANFDLLASDGRVIAQIERLRFQKIDFGQAGEVPAYSFEWQLADNQSAHPTRVAAPAPVPSALASKISGEIERLVLINRRREFYSADRPRIKGLAACYAARALVALGAGAAPFTIDDLMHRGRVCAEYRQLLMMLVKIGTEDGYLRYSGRRWNIARDRQVPDPIELWREIVNTSAELMPEMVMIARSGLNLTEIMRGEANAVQVLFGEKSSSVLEHLYESAPSFRIYNQIAAAALREIVAQWPADRPLRILEVGGGTAGLAISLLPAIADDDRVSYVFSDAAEGFFDRAQARLRRYRSVRYKTLDLDRDPKEQEFAPGSFDLIVGSEALHGASDLRRTLGWLHELLVSDGELLILEKHAERPTDLIFGSLPGWWNFTDADLRPDSPLLDPERWCEVLREAGFAGPIALSDASALPDDGSAGLPQHSVLLAQKASAAASQFVNGADHPPRNWLILSDEHGVGANFAASLADELSGAGHLVARALCNGKFERRGPANFTVSSAEPSHMSRLFSALETENHEVTEVVHLAGIGSLQSESLHALRAKQDQRCLTTIGLVQALHGRPGAKAPRLTLVTSSANRGPSSTAAPDPAQTPLWGLGRVVMNESPGMNCRLIDYHTPLESEGAARRLAAELLSTDDEPEVLLTPHRRYVHRARATSLAEQAGAARSRKRQKAKGEDAGMRLSFSRHGNIDNLRLSDFVRPAPGPGQVEVRVHAAGVNFRDVMWLMGLLPEEALENGFAGPAIGMECAGEIERVGADVTEFAPGDRVVAFGASCFASHAITDAAAAVKLPESISFEAGATIPTTFFTAYYALEYLARLQRGERVLIHGAAGGVGMAAIQIARRCGAEIFATAGTVEKREVVRWLGADHVLDSRSLAFADDIRALTRGAGIDVVLNSLAGEAIYKNLSILRPFGRFLEIGKRDFYANSKIGLRPFSNNLSYFGIDADQLFLERTMLTKQLLGEVMGLVARGELTPLPRRAFPISRAAEAFRQMQQSKQIGKLLITLEDSPSDIVSSRQDGYPIRSDATYLVTGGLTGFGLATAKWLAQRGAKHLALVGRRGAKTPEAKEGIAELEKAGASVRVFAVDVGNETAVAKMFDEMKTSMPMLRGIVHAAMVIEDQIIMNLDRESLHRALDPKIIGAWLLHRFTIDQPLDFFVLYSSATTLIGNPGQANYVAGCSYLEGLAHYRHALGLPALAIGWGALGEVGYVARNAKIQTHLARAGMKTVAPKQAFEWLDSLLTAGVASVTLAHFDWQRMRHAMPAIGGAQYVAVAGHADDLVAGGGSGDFRTTLSELEPVARHEAIVNRLKQLLGRVMGLSGSALDHDQPLEQLGVDSLMTVEIGELVDSEFGLTIPVMEMADKSIAEIAHLLAKALAEETPFSVVVESEEPQPLATGPAIVSVPTPSPERQWSLVAIPYAAAKGSVFSTWPGQLGENVKMLPLELPRISSGVEQSSPELADAVEQFGNRIRTEIDRPYVIYGHSIGALVAFELCRWIRSVGGPAPLHLFVGAFWAPQLLGPHSDALDSWTPGTIDKVTESLWFRYMAPLAPRAVRENPELLRRTLPALQADLAMLKGYRYREGEPLECPITCFAGANDLIIPRENVEGWRSQTKREFRIVEVPDGEHLFMRTHRDLIIDVIRDSTVPLLEQDLMEMSVAAD